MRAPMTGETAERFVVWNLRLLAATFALVGLLFIVTPDGVLGTLDDVGDWFGDFSPRPRRPNSSGWPSGSPT